MESDDVETRTKGGLPGMRGVEHIGLTVPNLEEATEFFVDVLGCEVVYSLNPPRRTDNYLDIHPETDRKIRTLSCRNGAHFELFEYTAPDQNKHMPKSSDYGGHHVTFYVDDMDAAIAYLKSTGHAERRVRDEHNQSSNRDAGSSFARPARDEH
jgi:catechol 2,3-dioxygenase-like lactoylglutathione lyase family enzyme